MTDSTALLAALRFAAWKHRNQRRKGAGAPPFINHAIEVAELIARVAQITDQVILQAAVLHDTLEDTNATGEEIEALFGGTVRRLVEEVTDQKRLGHAERKRLQIERAAALSHAAKLIRLADKIVNVQAVTDTPPVGWSHDRRLDYLEWTREVIGHCRGANEPLERLYDDALERGLARVREERDSASFSNPPSRRGLDG